MKRNLILALGALAPAILAVPTLAQTNATTPAGSSAPGTPAASSTGVPGSISTQGGSNVSDLDPTGVPSGNSGQPVNSSSNTARNIAIRIGGSYPTDGAAHSGTRDFSGSGGLSYTFGDGNPGHKVVARLDGDYAYFGKHGNSFEPFAITINGIVPLSGGKGVDSAGGAYAGLGIGAAYTEVGAGNSGFGSVAPNASSNHTSLAGKLLIGYNFTDRFFVEGNYLAVGRSNGVKPSTLNVQLGVRF